MALILDHHRKELRKQFEQLKAPVRLLVFAEAHACQFCEQTRQLVEEVSGLSDRIQYEIVNIAVDPERAAKYGVDKTPAIAVLAVGAAREDTGIRFFGIPSGYEFATLVDDILVVSRGEPGLGAPTVEWLATLQRPVHLQVFVTPT